MTSRESSSFSGLLGGYSSIYQGPRNRLGKDEDEEGKELVEEGDSVENEVEDSLEETPEAPQGPNKSLFKQYIVSQFETSLLKMMEKMTLLLWKLTQEVSLRVTSKASAFKNSSMKATYFLIVLKLID
ncbi:hypothetical protein O181_046180 [Austropuccinia psidii MF-1]|uniref:Uncharacterized protein n=1 Tax=Austropuccinia psidii MF-1 TaxID=1389203 RepID=A0A9Q3DSU7_9BASI|nr:hypothetical protein [Austropuccinia psidii MF-1]